MYSTDEDYLEIKLYGEQNLLYAKWKRSVSSEEYRTGVRNLVRLLQEEVYYLIIDSEKLPTLVIPEQQWLLREFCPLLANTKVRKMARIGNGDVFSYLVIDNLTEQASQTYSFQLAFKHCKTMEEAMEWLQLYESRHSA
ncbi:hypothetical protein I2I11_14760 [Pontibacter sp. 172403-2]|uniref:hypothetical protein n=1 Tax=Pontibacter rufus TaxID=2791028 RepID=UPI0018AFD0A5|nr:hypothetical protein [Pontibacter sp. 172403-2]MBF9254563.1 hypothetical protein [Pontibacter sp. 172403-2]